MPYDWVLSTHNRQPAKGSQEIISRGDNERKTLSFEVRQTWI